MDLRTLYLDALPAERQPQIQGCPLLAERLESFVSTGCANWPNLQVDLPFLMSKLAMLLPDESVDSEYLEKLSPDLFLACACLQGIPGALEAFERHCMHLDGALRAIGADSVLIDEVKQSLRTSLFASPTDSKLHQYQGRGALRSWVQVSAIRTVHKLRRRGKREVNIGDSELMDFCLEAKGDPEVEMLKAKYRAEFRQAFSEAVQQLTSREKNLLRQHHIDGLDGIALGRIYKVHRATASRWVVNARTKLMRTTHQRLKQRLNIAPSEVMSIMRLIESRLDASIQRVLKD